MMSREEHNAQVLRRYHLLVANGKCYRCKKPATGGRTTCDGCRAYDNRKRRIRLLDGRCGTCGSRKPGRKPIKGMTCCKVCRQRTRDFNERKKEERRRKKQ